MTNKSFYYIKGHALFHLPGMVWERERGGGERERVERGGAKGDYNRVGAREWGWERAIERGAREKGYGERGQKERGEGERVRGWSEGGKIRQGGS